MQNVLELMLYSYAVMVSGLLVPVLGMLTFKKPKPQAAIVAMLLGGGTTLCLIVLDLPLPYNIDENFFGITASLTSFLLIQYTFNTQQQNG